MSVTELLKHALENNILCKIKYFDGHESIEMVNGISGDSQMGKFVWLCNKNNESITNPCIELIESVEFIK